ncbi:MAG: phage distal tail protein [Eubacteriales bacterium]
MNPYIIFRLVLDNQELIISKTSVYRLISYDGIEAADIILSSEDNGNMDGGYIDSVRIGMRNILISFMISDRSQTEVLRMWLIKYFKPKIQGTLYVSRGGVTRRINCQLLSRPEYKQPNIISDRLGISINLICPDPYFLDENDTAVRISTVTPMINFPMTFFPSGGLTTGLIKISSSTSITNSGDADIGIICDITAVGGAVTNPKITIDGQEYVKVIVDLPAAHKLQVNTRKGEKDIKVDGVSVFLYDKASVFFSLVPGTHTVTITADAGVSYAAATYTYALKYLGV